MADLHVHLAPGRARQRHLGAALPRGAGRAGRAPARQRRARGRPRAARRRPAGRHHGVPRAAPAGARRCRCGSGARSATRCCRRCWAPSPPAGWAPRCWPCCCRRSCSRWCARFGLDGRPPSWRACWGAGLLVAVTAAFVPMAWALATVAVLVVAATGASQLDRRRVAASAGPLVVALVPPVLLLPWLPALVAQPQLLLLEAGLPGPGLSEPGPRRPGRAAAAPRWPGAAAAGAGGRSGAGRARRVCCGRPAAGSCCSAGWWRSAAWPARSGCPGPPSRSAPWSSPVPAWPGPLVLVAGAALVTAAVAGAAGARARVAGSSFGWRQPTALAGARAGRGDAGPHRRLVGLDRCRRTRWSDGTRCCCRPSSPPQGAQPDRPRTLVLRVPAGRLGRLRAAALRRPAHRRRRARSGPPDAGLDAAVADLASGRGGDAAARLVPYGVRFVLLTTPVEPAAGPGHRARCPGCCRSAARRGTVLWRVDYPTGRVRVLPPGAPVVEADGAAPPATVLPAGPGRVARRGRQRAAGPAARARRRRRTAAGGPPSTAPPSTPRRYDGWAQAFELPADGGRLRPHLRPRAAAAAALGAARPAGARRRCWPCRRSRASLDDADGNADVGADLPEPASGRRRGSRRRAVTGRAAAAGAPAGRCRCSAAVLLLAGLGVTADLTAPSPEPTAATVPAC